MRARPYVLGIETSCDDTAASLVDGDRRVLASVVSSQLAAHRPFGGVVPEIASREHLANWPVVSRELVDRTGVTLPEVDLVTATQGPGLIGSLLVGLSIGRSLAWALGKPFVAVHHLEGHLYSPFLGPEGEPAAAVPDRFVGLVVSGGHTALYETVDGDITTLAETRDDAMGEVFDKVGKRLGLAYPQGPRVDELAERSEPTIRLAVARCSDGSLDFSFSGLKSQTIFEIERLAAAGVDCDLSAERAQEPAPEVLGLLAAFRQSAAGQVLDRLTRLARARPFSTLAVSGGAAANRLLRRRLPEWAEEHGVELCLVPLAYSGDNAAMIAHAGLLAHRRGAVSDPLRVDAASRIPL